MYLFDPDKGRGGGRSFVTRPAMRYTSPAGPSGRLRAISETALTGWRPKLISKPRPSIDEHPGPILPTAAGVELNLERLESRNGFRIESRVEPGPPAPLLDRDD